MTAPKPWSQEALEAVARATREAPMRAIQKGAASRHRLPRRDSSMAQDDGEAAMTAPNDWPPEAREALLRAIDEADNSPIAEGTADALGLSDDWSDWHAHMMTKALAALAPFVAEIEAAAFKRGAEAMRDEAAKAAEDTDPEDVNNSWEEGWCDAVSDIAACIRALPIPEDKP